MGNEFENFKKMVELARNNDPDAQNDLGVYIMERASSRAEEEAVSWFYRAAKQGHPQGMNNLGLANLVGKGTNKDIASGLLLIESAFLLGVENAISFIVSAIQSGDVDIKELIELSNKGDIRTKWVIGICYDHGIGISKNTKDAYKYFKESADGDNPVALWITMNYEMRKMDPDWHYISTIVDCLRDVVEKQVGTLRNKAIKE